MFLQIKLKEDDGKFHRILWRDMDPLRPVKIYQYNRLVFGNSSSPFLSQTVLREHCKRNLDEYPLAAQSILESMYVDDLLDSVDTLSEAIGLRRELTSLLSSAGFEIRKWLSNKPEVLYDIPISDRLNKLSLEDGNLPSVKTLGILWKAENDLFTFEYTEPSFDRLTKRVVVSKTASLFDPLTLIAPFTIRAKLGIQKIWVRGLDWDDELPDDLGQQWRLWFSELALLSSINIPRCLIKDGSEVVNKTLHVFVDASEKAYAACCYIRCEYRDESVSNVLVVAKTRVAPLKTVSIPKLELCGAVWNAVTALCIDPGTVVLTDRVLNGKLKPIFSYMKLGQQINSTTTVDSDLVKEIWDKCHDHFKMTRGATCSLDCFYEAQGRLDGALCDYSTQDKKDFIRRLLSAGVINMEMEGLALFSYCHRAGYKAAMIAVAIVNRVIGDIPTCENNEIKEWEERPFNVALHFIKAKLGIQ